MTKDEILSAAEKTFNRFTATCEAVDTATFFAHPVEKWSVAENVQHMIVSTRMTNLAYRLPKWAVRLIGGKPNRVSRSFDELKAKYDRKLSEGGKASGRYVPKPLEKKYGKDKLLANWKKETAAFLKFLRNNRSEADLDNYLAGHPLLGKITLRELGYFTIFHTDHHLQAINKLTRTNP